MIVSIIHSYMEYLNPLAFAFRQHQEENFILSMVSCTSQCAWLNMILFLCFLIVYTPAIHIAYHVVFILSFLKFPHVAKSVFYNLWVTFICLPKDSMYFSILSTMCCYYFQLIYFAQPIELDLLEKLFLR